MSAGTVIGPKMFRCLQILAARGGSMRGKYGLARAVGPHGSNMYGDRIVMRCVKAGLIDLSGDPWVQRGYHVEMTDLGWRVLNSSASGVGIRR